MRNPARMTLTLLGVTKGYFRLPGALIDQKLIYSLLSSPIRFFRESTMRSQFVFLRSLPKLPIVCLIFIIGVPNVRVFAQSFESFGVGENQFSIQFVLIGDPNNNPAEVGNPPSAGSVPYSYRIGKFEISRQQVERANNLGSLGLTLDSMSFVAGTNGSGPRPSMPATGLTWNEAARFVNWLNTSQGHEPAYRFAVQPGQVGYNSNSNILLWDVSLSAVDSRGVNRYRHKDCRYFLPSLDEWFKAAYFEPGSNSYRTYPTGPSAPESVSSGIQAGTAVFDLETDQGPANIDQSGGLSSYGVMGLGGNVWEFEESSFDVDGGYNRLVSEHRGGRGGSWNGLLGNMSVGSRLNSAPNQESYRVGFRVASVAGDTSSQAEVLGGFVYYSGSAFVSDDLQDAIDPTKLLARQGEQPTHLTFQNLTNFVGGINGVVFDVLNLASPVSLSARDFEFKVSPTGVFDEESNPPENWQLAPRPSNIEVFSGNPSRVLIQWENEQILNRWLRIQLNPTSASGLQVPEVFFVGNLAGKTTDSSDSNIFTVQFSDLVEIRQFIGQAAQVGNQTDIDKNGLVQFSDLFFVRSQVGESLRNISVP